MKNLIIKVAIATVFVAPGMSMAADDMEQLQKEVDGLKRQNRVILERLEASMDMMEKSGKGGPSKTSIGGYGEMHYNNLSNNKLGGDDKKEIDLHRFILFVGHDISRISASGRSLRSNTPSQIKTAVRSRSNRPIWSLISLPA